MHLCVPECCLLCHASASGGICRDCLDDLCRSAVAGSQSCPRCGGIGDGISPCGSCQRKPPPFEKLWSSLHYEPPVSGLLHEFKHLRQIALKRLLAELMATLPPPWLHDAGIDGILAVPLSREPHRRKAHCRMRGGRKMWQGCSAWRVMLKNAICC